MSYFKKTQVCFLLGVVIFVFVGCKNEKHIDFEKIVFNTSTCFGTCSEYHLEINKEGGVRLNATEVYNNRIRDTTKIGCFVGKVVDDSVKGIIDELIKIKIDTLKFDGVTCCDGSVITMIVYYDGKRKYLQSMFPPEKANNLINKLYGVCLDTKLKRTNENFVIEGTGDDIKFVIPHKKTN